MKLLFLNSLKGLKKKKIQMLGITLLVMLSTGIYVAMCSSLDRMEDKYYSYLEEQKVEHISVDYYIDYSKEVTLDDLNYLLENNFQNISEEERYVLENYKYYLNPLIELLENPFNNPAYNYILDNIFTKYDADKYIKNKKLDELANIYDFEYELETSKTLKEEDTYIKLIPYNENKKINKAYLVEGNLPTNENEITMLPKYAKIHNIEIGDKYKIGEKEYKVVGFTYAPDYIYPLVSYSAIMFDEETNNVVYIYNDDYQNVNGIEEKTYSIYYHGKIKRQFDAEEMMNSIDNPSNERTKAFLQKMEK